MSEFIAEARVIVRPYTAGFRETLAAELAAATRTPLVVPVTAAFSGGIGGAAAATAALSESQTAAAASATGLASAEQILNSRLAEQIPLLGTVTLSEAELAAAAEAAGVAATQQALATKRLIAAQSAGANAVRALAASQAVAASAASEVGAAQIALSRSAAAVTSSQAALDKALRANNIALIDAASNTLRLAKAQELEAVTALSAARAQTKHAASMGFLGRGAGASALSLAGVRGATLAANAAFLVGAASVIGFAKAVQSAAALETELNVFRVTAGATADEMERVREAARDLGTDLTLPGVTAQDAASAMTQLAKAGLTVEDSLAGARGVLQLATAAQIDNIEATRLVASALNAFALEGEEAVRVADLLTGAANEAQGEITDMGLALQQSAAVARLAGLNVEDTVTLITLLAQAGLRGSDAGTSLRVALIRLINPTKAAGDALKGLNVEIRDAEGNIRPEVFADLAVALQGLSRAQRDAALATIFGTDALRAAAILGREGTQGFREAGEAITEQGLAAEQSAARMSGLTGSTENLKNQLSGLGISIGNLAKGPLKALADGLALNVRFLTFVTTGIEDLVNTLKDNAVTDFGGDLIDTTQKVGTFFDEITEGVPVLDGFFETLDKGKQTTDESSEGFRNAVSEIEDFVAALARLKEAAAETAAIEEIPLTLPTQVSVARAQGAGENQILALLRQQEARQTAFLERLLSEPITAAREKLIAKAAQNLENTENQIQAILDARTAAAEKQASDAKSAAAKVEAAQNEADQALISMLTQRRSVFESERGAAVAATTQLQDDIRFQNNLQALIGQQITKIEATVKNEEAKTQAINQLTLALIESEAADKELIAQQAENAAARRDQIQELNIQIAQETENEAALARAINARIRTLNKQIAAAKGDQVRVKQLILERERLKNQLEDLNQVEKDNRQTAQQFFFEQLQAQKGFVSNLLGNLITGPTAGLVGVPSPPSAGIPQLELGLGAAVGAAAGKAGAGPTAGQANTTNDILLRILEQLRALNSDREHPEATRQRRTQMAVMDYEHGQGGVM